MFSFYTDVLQKDEEEFWKISMRRWWGLFTMHFKKKERIEKQKEMDKQNQALQQMRAL
ncbi:hypothetical protein J5S49_13540 [Virgibacillus halodenitrificans]|uniref:hypothetical protein n=1 Tax=Virgibacillus halodenitrificans TaxID=1482 RepID=UPI001F374B57|nr:hypothetical protein [Virgibacillus halodenitrificans]MCG1029315.1 hypothetical protein [Virgibacillus halodenitrificans]